MTCRFLHFFQLRKRNLSSNQTVLLYNCTKVVNLLIWNVVRSRRYTYQVLRLKQWIQLKMCFSLLDNTTTFEICCMVTIEKVRTESVDKFQHAVEWRKKLFGSVDRSQIRVIELAYSSVLIYPSLYIAMPMDTLRPSNSFLLILTSTNQAQLHFSNFKPVKPLFVFCFQFLLVLLRAH